MSKQGMKRPERTHNQSRNDVPPVPEIQGKAKHGKAHANPIIAGTEAPSQKVWHGDPFSNDLATDNLENDLTAADLQD